MLVSGRKGLSQASRFVKKLLKGSVRKEHVEVSKAGGFSRENS